MPRTATASDWIALFALTIFWGTSFLFIELALVAFPPATLVAARISLGAGALLMFLLFSGYRLPRDLKTWRRWVLIALLGVILPMRLTTWGQQFITSAEAGVLMAISPLFVYSLGHFFLPGERLGVFRLAGFVIGFCGVVLVIGPDRLGFGAGDAGQTAAQLLGALAVLAAALSYSINSIYARRAAPDNPVALSAGMMLLATLIALPEGLLGVAQVQWPVGWMPAISIAILGLIGTGFSAVLYFRLVQGPGPGFVTLVTYLVPAWAVLAGALVLQEELGLLVYLGLGLILAGIALSELGPRLQSGIRGSMTRHHSGGTSASKTAVE